jgi:CTD small phosphatase-like protein 2
MEIDDAIEDIGIASNSSDSLAIKKINAPNLGSPMRRVPPKVDSGESEETNNNLLMSPRRAVKPRTPRKNSTPTKLRTVTTRNARTTPTKSRNMTPLAGLKYATILGNNVGIAAKENVLSVQKFSRVDYVEIETVKREDSSAIFPSPMRLKISKPTKAATETPKQIESLSKSVMLRETSKYYVQEKSTEYTHVHMESREVEAFAKLITSSPRRPKPIYVENSPLQNDSPVFQHEAKLENPFLAKAIWTPSKLSQPPTTPLKSSLSEAMPSPTPIKLATMTSSSVASRTLSLLETPNFKVAKIKTGTPHVYATAKEAAQVSMSGSNLFSPDFPHTELSPEDVAPIDELVMHDLDVQHDPVSKDLVMQLEDLSHHDHLNIQDVEFLEAVAFIGQLPSKKALKLPASLSTLDPAARVFGLLPPKDPQDHRLTLVLDLDETLVHCALGHIEPRDHKMIIQMLGREGPGIEVSIRWRPFLFKFLDSIRDKFEIVIFTASQRIYADTLLDIVDPGRRIISHRLFRDSCRWVNGNFIKDLQVLDRDLSRTIIVDNAYQAYGYNVSNGYPIISWFDDPNDKELPRLVEFLQQLDAPGLDVRPVIRKAFPLYRRVLLYRNLHAITLPSDDFPPAVNQPLSNCTNSHSSRNLLEKFKTMLQRPTLSHEKENISLNTPIFPKKIGD